MPKGNRSLPTSPFAGTLEAAGIEPARDSLPNTRFSRAFRWFKLQFPRFWPQPLPSGFRVIDMDSAISMLDVDESEFQTILKTLGRRPS